MTTPPTQPIPIRPEAGIRLTGQQISDGYVAWFNEEMKQLATRPYDFAKFLATISFTTLSAAVGLFGALSKLDDWKGLFSIAAFLVSCGLLGKSGHKVLVGLRPNAVPLDEQHDLERLRLQAIGAVSELTTAWFRWWIAGLVAFLLSTGLGRFLQV
jgi:hypothetical protein